MEETFLFLLLSYALTPSLSQRKRESPTILGALSDDECAKNVSALPSASGKRALNSEPHLATRFEATILNST